MNKRFSVRQVVSVCIETLEEETKIHSYHKTIETAVKACRVLQKRNDIDEQCFFVYEESSGKEFYVWPSHFSAKIPFSYCNEYLS